MTAAALQRAISGGWLAVMALALAVLIGGGGSPAPVPEVILELAVAGLALAWWFALNRPLGSVVPRESLLIAAIMLALPLLQLIPLPPQAWQALPGRGDMRDALDLVGRASEWRSVSLDPARTLASLLAMVPAALMLIMASALDRRGRYRLVATLAAGALATVLVGAAQLSQGPDSALRFYGPGSVYLEGFQANHNSTADMLLIGLIAAIAVIRESALRRGGLPNHRGPVLALALAAASLIGLGVVLTASRAGMALLPVALIASFALLRPWLVLPRRGLAVGLVALIAAGLLGGVVLSRNEAIGRVADRFSFAAELRPDLWTDSLAAARAYAPVGTGMGNFVPALLMQERLEVVRPTMPNRAHNDYLELAVEAGVPGLLALAAIGTILLRMLGRARRDPPAGSTGLALCGASCLLILALHSLVDYPIRSMSLALIAAACAGIIMPSRVAVTRQDQTVRLEEAE